MALLSARRLHTGRVINLDLDDVRFPNGATGQLEMVRHPGAAAVLPFLDPPSAPDPRVILLRQFRHAADGYIDEVPAGRLDSGETPAQCAQRELQEETGYTASHVVPLLAIYTTPGFTDERIHLFCAHGLSPGAPSRDIDELIELQIVPWSEVRSRVRRGRIQDAKTLTTLLFCEAHVVGPPARKA